VKGVTQEAGSLSIELLCVYVTCWSIRYRFDLDYKLGWIGQMVRWLSAALGYEVANLAGAKFNHLHAMGTPVFLAFFCWPNFAYYLTNLFRPLPTTTATVESTHEEGDENHWLVSYSFEQHGESYGGTTKIRATAGSDLKQAFPIGGKVTIQADPLNPSKSKLVARRDGRKNGKLPAANC
jgi:hypothetical protein